MGIESTTRLAPEAIAAHVATAITRIDGSISMLDELSATYGTSMSRLSDDFAATKAGRTIAYERNLSAQAELEPVVRGMGEGDPRVTDVERAVSRLKDANWMLASARNVSRDFSRLDFEGAIADSRDAIRLLRPFAPESSPPALGAGAAAPVASAAPDEAITQLAFDLRHGNLQTLASNVAVVDTRTNLAQLVSKATWDAAQAPAPRDYAQILANDLRLGNVRGIDEGQVALFHASEGRAQLVDRVDYERALALNAAE